MTLLKSENLGKSFRQYSTEWARLARWLGLPLSPSSETWVLQAISFELGPGEAIGLIGQNGAGKSTLLKIITGTLQPTSGKVTLSGRVSAILELGMGFQLEMTGRQNATHACGLMGFSGEQARQMLPEIESFAEIGEYFDKPMRMYSSGMQMRVAFAVATAQRPDLLIVDEALSVGDAYFQHKSFNRIRDFQELGTALLIVSHDAGSIKSLCSRCILIDHGQILKDGPPAEVLDFYNAIIAEKENSTVAVERLGENQARTTSGTGEATVEEIALYNRRAEPAEFVHVGEHVHLKVKVKVHQALEKLVFGFSIRDRLGQIIFGTNTWYTEQVLQNVPEGSCFEFDVGFHANLGVGSYSVQTALVDSDTHLTSNYQWIDLALVFSVVNVDKPTFIGSQWSETEIVIAQV